MVNLFKSIWLRVGLLTVLLGSFLAYQQFFSKSGSAESGSSLSADTCAQKDFCILVYLAPWCPHCKTAVPQVRDLLSRVEREADVGMRVIVGMASEAESVQMGRSLGQGVTIDANGDLARRYQVRGVPAFLVAGRDGVVVRRDVEARAWISERLAN